MLIQIMMEIIMNTPNDYKAVYKNTGLTARTYDQAYNTPDYAISIWKCETDNKRAIKSLLTWAVASLMIVFIFSSVYALIYMFAG